MQIENPLTIIGIPGHSNRTACINNKYIGFRWSGHIIIASLSRYRCSTIVFYRLNCSKWPLIFTISQRYMIVLAHFFPTRYDWIGVLFSLPLQSVYGSNARYMHTRYINVMKGVREKKMCVINVCIYECIMNEQYGCRCVRDTHELYLKSNDNCVHKKFKIVERVSEWVSMVTKWILSR